jgi:hypothetical protein
LDDHRPNSSNNNNNHNNNNNTNNMNIKQTKQNNHVSNQYHNHKLLSVKFNDMAIHSAQFTQDDGHEIIVTGRKPYYYAYDIEHGQLSKFMIPNHQRDVHGTKSLERAIFSPNHQTICFLGSKQFVHLVDTRSKQWIWDLQLNSSVRSACFVNDYTLVTGTVDAEVYLWDLRYLHPQSATSTATSTSKNKLSHLPVQLLHRFHHDDGTSILSLSAYHPSTRSSSSSLSSSSLSEDNRDHTTIDGYSLDYLQYLCIGSASGVTSVYQHDFTSTPTPNPTATATTTGNANATANANMRDSSYFTPLKSIMNLTTRITSSAFHPTGQLLAIASDEVRIIILLYNYRNKYIFIFIFFIEKRCIETSAYALWNCIYELAIIT